MKNGNLSAQSPSKTLIAIFVVIVIATTAACVYGCAPKETSEQATAQSAEEAPVMQGEFSFSADSDCATCHETEGGSMTDGNCPAANHAAQSCIDCHTDIDGLTSVHDGVAYGDKTAKRLKKTVVDEATCLTDVCHGSYEHDPDRQRRNHRQSPRYAGKRRPRDDRLRQLPRHARFRRYRENSSKGVSKLPSHGHIRVLYVPRIANGPIAFRAKKRSLACNGMRCGPAQRQSHASLRRVENSRYNKEES